MVSANPLPTIASDAQRAFLKAEMAASGGGTNVTWEDCPKLPGYKQVERLVLRVYVPVTPEVLAGALGANSQGMTYMTPGGQRQVRVNPDDCSIELWEMRMEPEVTR